MQDVVTGSLLSYGDARVEGIASVGSPSCMSASLHMRGAVKYGVHGLQWKLRSCPKCLPRINPRDTAVVADTLGKSHRHITTRLAHKMYC